VPYQRFDTSALLGGEKFPFYKGVCTPIDLRREDYLPAAEGMVQNEGVAL